MSLLLSFTIPKDLFSQGGSCSNPQNISLSNQVQQWSFNMSGMNEYYLSFTPNDTAVNFSIQSINSIPNSLKLHKLNCSNDLVTESFFTTDSNGVNKIKLNHYDVDQGVEYILIVEQSQSNSLSQIELQGFIPVYNLTPECNLVTNGSFEETIINAPLGDLNEEIEQCIDWRAPINNPRRAPDYFTSNSSDPDYQVPSNFLGNIPSMNTGNTNNAYAGMFSVHSGPGNQGNLRELMSTTLDDPLVPGQRYLVEMYVNLAPSTAFFSNNTGIPPGIKFSEEYAGGQRLIDLSNSQIVALEADIQPTNIISTTTNWVKISEVYVASGGENTLTVANFLSNSESVTAGRQSLPNNLYFFVDEISVTPLDLCCTNPPLVIEDGWDVADLMNSNEFAPYITGNTLSAPPIVYLEGEFTVNTNFIIDNTFIKVNDATGKINITSGNSLEVIDSEIKACGLMWEGIYVNGTNAEVIVDNSTIADALKGVNSINGGVFTISNSIFDANNYGVYVDSYNGSHQGSVQGTTFKSSYLLKDFFLTRPVAGVYLNEVVNTSGTNSITIGSIYAENKFIGPTPGYSSGPYSTLNPGLQYGIIIDKSTADIYNNEFESFIKNDVVDSQEKSGIKVVGTPSGSYYPNNYTPLVNIGSYSVSQQNEFKRSTAAIHSVDIVDLNIIGNDISFANNQNPDKHTDFAIEIIENYFPALVVDVIENNITGVVNGILISDCNEQDRIKVDNNYISLANTEGNTAVFLGNNLLNSSNYVVKNNDISRVTFGVNVIGGRQPRIIDNDIEINNTYYSPFVSHNGISIHNTTKINGSNVEIKNNQINTPSIISNTMINGLFISNISYQPEINCNVIKRTGTGMKFSNSFNPLGVVFPIYGNEMEYNYNAFVLTNNAELGDIGSPSKPSDNEWRFNSNYDTYTDGADGSQTTFFTRGGGVPYEPMINSSNGSGVVNINTSSTGDFHDCEGGVVIGPGLMALQDSLPDFENQYHSDTTQWIAKYQYYRLLPEDSLIRNKSVQSFKDSMHLSPLGDLLRLKSSNDTYTRKSSQLAIISSNTTQESRLKTVIDYQLQASNANWDTLASLAQRNLENIALDCPYEAGPAVYEARSLLKRYTGKNYFNPCEGYTSNPKSSKRIKSNNIADEAEDAISLYPNPVKDELNIQIQLDEDEVAHWKILNVKGQMIQSGKLNTNKNTLYLSNLGKGVYIFQLRVNNQLKKTNKLIIQ